LFEVTVNPFENYGSMYFVEIRNFYEDQTNRYDSIVLERLFNLSNIDFEGVLF